MEKILTKNLFGKGKSESEFYDLLKDSSPDSSESKLNAWKTDLQEEISLEQTGSGNTRLRLLQYNWLMRVYITPEKISKFNLNIQDTCNRCGVNKGTLFHCLWSVSKGEGVLGGG